MKIIAIGDSLTYGQNVRAEAAWPALLAVFTGHDVRNAGVCGDTTRLGLERFPKAVQLHAPDLVVIQFGHNDANCWETDGGLPRVSAASYVANIDEMIERSRCETIVLGPHPAPGRDEDYNRRLEDYHTVGEVMVTPVSVLEDGYGLHPDPFMHLCIAHAVMRAMA